MMKYINKTIFKYILNRHEQASIIAAEGYARATGKVGVSIVTSGPGFTNAVTGLADALYGFYSISGYFRSSSTTIIGTDGFQEIDAVGISLRLVQKT